MKLNSQEFLCRNFCLRKSKTLEILKICENFLNKHMSLEKFIKENYQIEKILNQSLGIEGIHDYSIYKIPFKIANNSNNEISDQNKHEKPIRSMVSVGMDIKLNNFSPRQKK